MKNSLSFTVLDEFHQPTDHEAISEDFSKLRIKLPDTGSFKGAAQCTCESPGHWIDSQPIPGFEHVSAFPFQKILIVRIDDSGPQNDLLKENASLVIPFTPFGSPHQINLLVRVIRVCEYANPDSEYGFSTNTVLIEWSASKPPFGTFSLADFGVVLMSQTENLDIQATVNSKPGSPITAVNSTPGLEVKDSDFTAAKPEGDIHKYPNQDPIVAVVDTGLKTHFVYTEGQSDKYPDKEKEMVPFHIGEVSGEIESKRGYCSVTEYLRASKDADVAHDSAYLSIPTYNVFHRLTKAQILNSPSDDHLLVDNSELSFDNEPIKVGRHGTIISAIINQKGNAAVLPVKVFNQGGFGTLYDLLCGLNYILDSHRRKLPIRVVNLSFTGQFHPDSYQMMYTKFNCFEQAGIWVVAAAGNEGKKLIFTNFSPTPAAPKQVLNLFPACFSKEFTNVITVTGVEVASWKLVRNETSCDLTLTPILPQSAQDTILEKLNLNKTGLMFVPATYRVLHNYATDFVNVGVVGPFTSVFFNAETEHQGSSFAAAFFSAKLAEYLKRYPAPTRDEILDKLTFTGAIAAGEIQRNRLINYS
jgi:hypothetical protein